MELFVASLIWLYYQCAHFMVHFADFTGMTYRDANCLLFFIIWPMLSIGLFAWCSWNTILLLQRPSVEKNTEKDKIS